MQSSGLYYKHMLIVNDNSSVVIKWSFKLIGATRSVIYESHMFIVQATGVWKKWLKGASTDIFPNKFPKVLIEILSSFFSSSNFFAQLADWWEASWCTPDETIDI